MFAVSSGYRQKTKEDEREEGTAQKRCSERNSLEKGSDGWGREGRGSSLRPWSGGERRGGGGIIAEGPRFALLLQRSLKTR